MNDRNKVGSKVRAGKKLESGSCLAHGGERRPAMEKRLIKRQRSFAHFFQPDIFFYLSDEQ